jgi:hypothetical protein
MENGRLVYRAPPEQANKDVLHYDDVIITGSLCVGFDCQDGESFGFDTIILKEHNLRIYFNDTSYTASYPTNNWRMTVNDSTNGGASYFSIDDVDDGTSIFKIEAGAPSNSLYVEDYGRVGLGTSTPVVELHIKDSDTPTNRLEQDSSGGWTAQTWDVAGNESNFFIRDATNGSKLPFRIQPGTPSSTLSLKSDGNVGIGTWSPADPLHVVQNNSNAALQLEVTGTTSQKWTMRTQSSGGGAGNFEIRNGTGTATIPFRIGPAPNSNILLVGLADATTPDPDRVSITGELFINGVNNSNPDYVFEPTHELESIEEHARYMWENKHLPAVGCGVNGQDGKASINVATRSQGVLEELEKAHIYIEQLHKKIGELEGAQADTGQMQATIEDLQKRLEKLEDGSVN